MGFEQLTQLGVLLKNPDPRRLESAYVRARPGADAPWVYSLVGFGTPATPNPAPIYFSEPTLGVASRPPDGEASVTLGVEADLRLSIRISVRIDSANRGSGHQVDLVISPGETVADAPAPGAPPLSVVALSLGRHPSSLGLSDPARERMRPLEPNGLPELLTVTVIAATETTGLEDSADVAVEDSAGLGLIAWFVEGPRQQEQAWRAVSRLGRTVLAQVTATTVDLDAPSTGARVGLAHGVPANLATRLTTSWAPPARPAVQATVPMLGPGDALPRRYLVAALRQDDSESPAGATSDVVEASAGSHVEVLAPEAPDMGPDEPFAAWVVYRATRTNGTWGTPQRVGVCEAQRTIVDMVPPDDSPPEPPVGGLVKVEWGSDGGQPDPVPARAPLIVTGAELDEEIPQPATPVSVTRLLLDELPMSGTASYRSGRDSRAPHEIEWRSSAAALSLAHYADRTMTDVDVHLALPAEVQARAMVQASGPTAVWATATERTELSGFAHFPAKRFAVDEAAIVLPTTFSGALTVPNDDTVLAPSDGHRVPVSIIAFGWRAADSMGQVRGRITTVTPGGIAASTEITVPSCPVEMAAWLRLPVPLANGSTDPESPLDMQVGPWADPAVAGRAPSHAMDPSVVELPLDAPVPDVLVRHGPARTGALVPPGPAGRPRLLVEADLRSGEPTEVAARAFGVRSLTLRRPEGEEVSFGIHAHLDRDAPVRLSLHLGTPPESFLIRGRLQRLVSPAELTIGVATVSAAARLQEPMTGGPLDLTIARPDGGEPLEGVRVAVDTDTGDPGRSDRWVFEVDRLPPATLLRAMSVPIPVIDPNTGAVVGHDWRHGGLRVDATVPGGAHLRATGRLHGIVGISPLTADLRLPNSGHLRIGSVGTLAEGSTATRFFDPHAVFTADWIGRKVAWHGGWGTVTGIDGPQTLLVSPVTGPPPNPAEELLAWWRVGGTGPDDEMDGGFRLHIPDGTLEGSVGFVVSRREDDHLRLRAPTAGVKLCIEGRDDTTRFFTPRTGLRGEVVDDEQEANDGRAQLVAVAARLAVRGVAVSSWKVAETDLRTAAPMSRFLVRGLYRPAPDEILDETPEQHTISSMTLDLPEERRNRSLLAAVRLGPGPWGAAHDALHLRLEDTPDRATITQAPGVIEIDADRSYGPGQLVAEPTAWYRDAPGAEVHFTRAQIEELPPFAQMSQAGGCPGWSATWTTRTWTTSCTTDRAPSRGGR